MPRLIMENFDLRVSLLSREAQLFVGWVSGSVTHAGVGFHALTQPTFILYLIPPTHLCNKSTVNPLRVEPKQRLY